MERLGTQEQLAGECQSGRTHTPQHMQRFEIESPMAPASEYMNDHDRPFVLAW